MSIDTTFARAPFDSKKKDERGMHAARESFGAEEKVVRTDESHKIEASLFRFAETLHSVDSDNSASQFRSLPSALKTVFSPKQEKLATRSGPFRFFVVGAAMAAVFITLFTTIGASLMVWAKGLLDAGDPATALGLAIAAGSLFLVAAIINMLIRLPV